MVNVDQAIPFEARWAVSLPLLETRVAAGFPSPADDHSERRLDLNEHLVRRPLSTFFLRVEGESMSDAGILSGDMIAVDKAATPGDGAVVVAEVDGEFTVKRLRRAADGTWRLRAESREWPATDLPCAGRFRIWGVVVAVVRRC
jgi:DNA polymerase V